MNRTSGIEYEGVYYGFEPPVEHGREKINTLAELAAIALIGDSSDGPSVAVRDIQMLIDAQSGDPDKIAETLTGLLGNKEHTVSVKR